MVPDSRQSNCIVCQAVFSERHVGEQTCERCLGKLFSFKNIAIKENFFGNAPAPFVGCYGYPRVNVGILSPGSLVEDAWRYDAPHHWSEENYAIPQIAQLRASLVNSRTKAMVKDVSKIRDVAQEVGMASKPVEIEVDLKKKPQFRMYWEQHSAPMGPTATLKRIRITSNPKIPTSVEKVFADTDLKAAEAVNYLYSRGIDEYSLSRMLSVGTFGVQHARKLVPTRWSITASDDIIGKRLITEVKDYAEADYQAFHGSYLGNNYLIMLFPEAWSYELVETYASFTKQHKIWTDYEAYEGRKTYASDTAGGYYAARLGILEKLRQMKRQASVLALRFVTDEYSMPLGVWVVRQAVRKTMAAKPLQFSSRELMLKYAAAMTKKKFDYKVEKLYNDSKLLKFVTQQKRLQQYLT